MLTLRSSTLRLPVPEAGTALAGYASCRALTSTDGDLTASFALLADDRGSEVIVGSIDTLFVSQRLLDDLRASVSVPDLLFFSTHTHNAPSLARELPRLGKVDDAWYTKVLGVLTRGLKDLRDKPPIEVSAAYGERATTLNVNRRKRGYVLDYPGLLRGRPTFVKKTSMAPDQGGPVDARVRLFSFDNAAGTQAILWSFAAHPAFYPGFRAASADFPGLIRERLKALCGEHCCTVYLPGFAGSAIPRLRQRLAMRPSEFVQRLLPFWPMLPSPSRAGYARWVANLFAAVRAAHDARQVLGPNGELSVKAAFVPEIFSDSGGQRSIGLRASYLTFGKEAGILAYSGEMLGEWARHLDGPALRRVIASGYLGGDCLYVPPSDQLGLGGYEVDGFQPYFGLNGGFRNDITERVVAATRRLIADDQAA